MNKSDIISLVSIGLQAILVLVITPLSRRISKLEEHLESTRDKMDCNFLMCKHDGEIKGIKETLLEHQGKISRLEGRIHEP